MAKDREAWTQRRERIGPLPRRLSPRGGGAAVSALLSLPQPGRREAPTAGQIPEGADRLMAFARGTHLRCS